MRAGPWEVAGCRFDGTSRTDASLKTASRMRVLLLFSLSLCAWADRAPDVRNVTWGMTRAEVIAAESGSSVQASDEGALRYAVTDLAKSDASVLYGFANGKLVRATYIFAPEHANANDFVADFHEVTERLIAKHKKPSCERALWLDDSLQNERIAYLQQDRALPSDILPSDVLMGLSIALGHLELYSTWDGGRTQILHMMTGRDHKIYHRVEYRSVELFASNQSVDTLEPAQVCVR